MVSVITYLGFQNHRTLKKEYLNITKIKKRKLLVAIFVKFTYTCIVYRCYFKFLHFNILSSPKLQYIFLLSDVINEINKQIATKATGRLFAIIYLAGQQFKVTENDIIIVSGHWPPQPGDKLNLEKVLLLGSKDFTLVGRPILNRELVSVNATVIQKTLSHTITRFRMKKRKQFRRINCKILNSLRVVKFETFYVFSV